jgi:hypothetical protein
MTMLGTQFEQQNRDIGGDNNDDNGTVRRRRKHMSESPDPIFIRVSEVHFAKNSQNLCEQI